MKCPLCSGPVPEGQFQCEVGHRVTGDPDPMLEATEPEISEALWMAIQALDNEADVLRAVGGDEAAAFADDAQRQTRQLREFARQQAPSVESLGADDA